VCPRLSPFFFGLSGRFSLLRSRAQQSVSLRRSTRPEIPPTSQLLFFSLASSTPFSASDLKASQSRLFLSHSSSSAGAPLLPYALPFSGQPAEDPSTLAEASVWHRIRATFCLTPSRLQGNFLAFDIFRASNLEQLQKSRFCYGCQRPASLFPATLEALEEIEIPRASALFWSLRSAFLWRF